MTHLRIAALFTALALASASLTAAADLERRPAGEVVLRASGVLEDTLVPVRPLAKTAVQTATFEVTYDGFSPEAEEAFQAAVDIWSTLVVSDVPIRVEATWEALDEGVLGSAGGRFIWRGFTGAPAPSRWYLDALADSLAGRDLNPGEADIVARFNSDFDDWYIGTDGQPGFGEYDLTTVVLHELGHGLGFVGSAQVDEELGSLGAQGFPYVYDVFVVDGAGVPITDENTYPNPSDLLTAGFESGALYWSGPAAVAVNDEIQPRLYAPAEWSEGSSYSHLDETTYPAGNRDSLMTPQLGRREVIHDPGPITLCLFEDMGWTTAETCGDVVELISTWVPVVAAADGLGDSVWRTRLGLLNRSTENITAELVYRDGATPPSTTVEIPAGGQTVIDDVVGFLGASGSAPLEVRSSGPADVAARIFNTSVDGTYGQYLEGASPGAGLVAGDTVWLQLLEESPQFRTNIGFTNTGDEVARATVTLFDGAGDQMAAYQVTVQPGRNVQSNRPFFQVGGSSFVVGGYASVTVTQGEGVFVYGSVIDNSTDDPTTILPRR